MLIEICLNGYYAYSVITITVQELYNYTENPFIIWYINKSTAYYYSLYAITKNYEYS